MTDAANTPDGASDLAILFPERHASIAGVAVIMREYGFAESLHHGAAIQAFSDAITGLALAGNFHDLDSLRAVFSEQAENVFRLIAIACDQPVEWVKGLDATSGEQLLMLWWAANTDFFLRRVLQSVQLRKLREVDGPTFTPSSPVPDTGPNPSPGTRTVN